MYASIATTLDIAADSGTDDGVALGTDTTGSYVGTITAGTGTGQVQRTYTGTSGVDYTGSIWIKRKTGTDIFSKLLDIASIGFPAAICIERL